MALFCIMGLTNCKTVDDKASVWDSKRAEIEAIATEYSDKNPYGPVNWSTLEGLLKDDAVVEHFDIDLYRQCLDMNIAISQEKELLMKSSGCNALYEQFFQSGPDNKDESLRKGPSEEALAKCDSIQNSFKGRREKAMIPCLEWHKKIQLAHQNK